MRYCMTLYLKGHWKYEMSNLELLNLLNKNGLFWNFQIWPLVFPMPLEIQSYTVPHLKALISGKLEPRGLRFGSTFILCHALLNKAILLHKRAYLADLFSSECTEFRLDFGSQISTWCSWKWFSQLNLKLGQKTFISSIFNFNHSSFQCA